MNAKSKKFLKHLLVERDTDKLDQWSESTRSPLRQLFSLSFDTDRLVCSLAIEAIGRVSAGIAQKDKERVRNFLRSLLWSMSEESGGIGWHAPEAIAEICINVPDLAEAYSGLLPQFLKEESLRPSALAAMKRLARFMPELIIENGSGIKDAPTEKEIKMEHIPSIELAIKNEKAEMKYYLGESKRSINQVTKALFLTLAEDENEHMARLRLLHDKLTKDGSWPESVPLDVKGTNIESVLSGIARDRSSAQEHNMDDIEALKKSIEFEAKGSKFYSDLATDCDNPKEKEFFNTLSRIERQHMLSIQDSLAYLEDTEAWFAQNERSGLDGA